MEPFEKDDLLGGMFVHFDFSGLDIEKYYHLVCGPDEHTFGLMKEPGVYGSLNLGPGQIFLFSLSFRNKGESDGKPTYSLPAFPEHGVYNIGQIKFGHIPMPILGFIGL